jgi:hypothetical protein
MSLLPTRTLLSSPSNVRSANLPFALSRLLLCTVLVASAAGCPDAAPRWEIRGHALGPPITLETPHDEAEFELILKVSRRAFPKENNGSLLVGVTIELVDGERLDARLTGAGLNPIERSLRAPGTRTFIEASLQYSCDLRECLGRAQQRVAGAGTIEWEVSGVLDSGLVKVGEEPPVGQSVSIEIVAVE